VNDTAAFTAIVRGRVQGVFFRAFVQRHARQLGISGYVRNLPDRSVEVRAEGERQQLEALAGYLRSGPPASSVREVNIDWLAPDGQYNGFHITY
jgi:acylphosphatase